MIFGNMLNKKAQKNGGLIIEQLGISEGSVIADIGSGGGYFACSFAKKTGKSGIVYAIDTDPKLLASVTENAEKMNLTNIKTVLSDETGPNIPQKHYDLLFLSNVFHHIKNPIEYFSALKNCLKENGRVAVIDYDERNKFSFIALTGHTTKESIILETMDLAGFSHLDKYPILKKQSFNIFGVAK